MRIAHYPADLPEVDPAHDLADDRHDHLVHERGCDGTECPADDHGYRQIYDVTAIYELQERFEHGILLCERRWVRTRSRDYMPLKAGLRSGAGAAPRTAAGHPSWPRSDCRPGH